jgi:hypothetical protein
MLPGLYDDERCSLMRLAAMLILGGIAVLPLTTQGSSLAGAADAPVHTETATLATPARLVFPGFSVSRDPFVPTQAVVVSPQNTGSAPVVRAIVLGDPARALVEEDGTVRVLAVGDRVGGLRVAAITARGIWLSDGTRGPLTVARRP